MRLSPLEPIHSFILVFVLHTILAYLTLLLTLYYAHLRTNIANTTFKGFMVTQHKWAINNTIAAAAALNAGVDLNLGPDVYAKSLPEALSLGLVTMDTITTSLQRVLLARLQMGMLDDTKTRNQNPWNQIPMSVVDSKKHRALARTLATESVVLLKNNQNGTLQNANYVLFFV